MVEEAAKKPDLPVAAVPHAEAAAVVRPQRKPGPAANAPAKPKPAAENEKNKVVHIVRRLQEDANQRLSRKRPPWLLLSVLAAIALPTFLVAVYYLFIAADQYVSEARFSVRSNEQQAADVLGMVAGMPRATVVSDSYIVSDYIRSREMVAELEKRVPLREIYSHENADFITRLDPDVTQEELVDYWNRRIDVFFDSTKSTIAIEVQAFVPQNAEQIAVEIVDIVRELVNDLSMQARRDAVQFAASEVARAELRVRGARDDMLAFRIDNNALDPTATAAATLGIVAGLESQRSQFRSQLASVSGYLGADAPSVQMLNSRIAALDAEIASVQSQVSLDDTPADGADGEAGANSSALAGEMAEYQELLLNQEFAEKAYAAALGSLERARAEADRTQSYLANYINPGTAEEATYPRRVLNIFIAALLATILWGIGTLGFLTVRDHMP